jgi:hypothetical protein
LRYFRNEYTELLQKDTYGPNCYGGGAAKESEATKPEAATLK